MIRWWFLRCFDPTVKFVLMYGRARTHLVEKLGSEAAVFSALKAQKGGPGGLENLERAPTRMEHFVTMVQVNHQRVAASISHISLMIAVLLFSYTNLLKTEKSDRINWLQTIIAVEVCFYLIVAIALIRCLRDLGLYKRYFSDVLDYKGVESYEADFLEELAFRYHLLSVGNFAMICQTIVFAIVLMLHFFLPPTLFGAAILDLQSVVLLLSSWPATRW